MKNKSSNHKKYNNNNKITKTNYNQRLLAFYDIQLVTERGYSQKKR